MGSPKKKAVDGAESQIAIMHYAIDELRPYLKNARTHSPQQVDAIAKSMLEFGFTNPVLLDGNKGVIAGHGRILAAQQLWSEGKSIKRCVKGMVPCIDIHGLTEAQKRALVIADNQLALAAGWDTSILVEELTALQAAEFELSLLGFGDELMKLLRDQQGPDPDYVPPVAETPISVVGDIWRLGNHRLICGDSTDEKIVSAVLNGVKPHLMVTDPPYGIDYDPSWRKKVGLHHTLTSRWNKIKNDDRADWGLAWALFPGDVVYIWHADLHGLKVAQSLIQHDFEIRSLIIWAKDKFSISRGHYHSQHESCVYAVKKGATGHWAGDRKQTTLWAITSRNPDAKTVHATQKPVECMRRPMENNSSIGQAVYEPFAGSGTAIIAAEQIGRHCYAIEIDPLFVDVAVKRWETFTGKQAVLAGTQKTFAAIASERTRKRKPKKAA